MTTNGTTTSKGDSPVKGLYAKIADAQRAITHIKPNQKVDKGPMAGHKYASKNDVFIQVKEKILEAGLVVLESLASLTATPVDTPDKDGVAGNSIMTIVTMNFKIVDTATGEYDTVGSCAVNVDKPTMADYAAQSAATSAIRQFYADFFQAPVLEECDTVPPASQAQKDKIKELYGQVTIDRDTWGHMIGMQPSEYRAPEEEFKRGFAQLWAGMSTERAASMISQLEIIKVLQAKPTVKGTDRPAANAGGIPAGVR